MFEAEQIKSTDNTMCRVLVNGVLSKGNRWFWWWPDGMKMSGFIGDVREGRLVEVVND